MKSFDSKKNGKRIEVKASIFLYYAFNNRSLNCLVRFSKLPSPKRRMKKRKMFLYFFQKEFLARLTCYLKEIKSTQGRS